MFTYHASQSSCLVMVMQLLQLSGSAREIGLEHGRQLKKMGYQLPQNTARRLAFARMCLPSVEKYAPDLLVELEGISEGGNYHAENLMAWALAPIAYFACSVVAVSGDHTIDGQPIFGRNLDWYHRSKKYLAVCQTAVSNSLSNWGVSDTFSGRYGGVNEAGLALALTYVAGPRDRPGIIYTLAIRAALNQFDLAGDAAEFLAEIPHVRSTNFLLADANGEIFIVEASARKVQVTAVSSGFAAVTNEFQSRSMAKQEIVGKRPQTSHRRLCNLQEWFAERTGPIAEEAVQDVLKRPFPLGVCAMSNGRARASGTIWSWTAVLGKNQISLADGPPFQTPYFSQNK